MNDNSKFKLGLFIIFAAVVFFAALFILGTMDRFKEKAYISTLVSESVQGLSIGSSVKYQGVPIGSVREIAIYPRGNVIRIDMEINNSSGVSPKESEYRIRGGSFKARNMAFTTAKSLRAKPLPRS